MARRNALCIPAWAVLASLAWPGAAAAAPEVWLASTPECNACAIFDEVAERRHYGESVVYRHNGLDRRLALRRVAKSALSDGILAQLPAGTGPENPYWAIQLTVIVVDGERVLAAGNIAESADPAAMTYPPEVMRPPARPPAGDPSLREGGAYRRFFLEQLNLEYFAAVALGDRLPRPSSPAVDLASSHPVDPGPAAVVLWGSAGRPIENALYLSQRIREIRAEIVSLDIRPLTIFTLYGDGPASDANDTSYQVDGVTRFRRVDLSADLGSSADGLNRVLTGVARTPGNRSLLVQVGHSGPAGSPLWGSLRTFMPDDLARLADTDGGELVMVSGGCHSGMFARSVSCGFFAAHPEVLASGCQRSAAAIEASDDYLRYFFRAAVGRADTDAGGAGADTAGGGRRGGRLPTLAEAHWHAASRLEDHQIAYTTTDAIVDGYYAAHPGELPDALSTAEVAGLARMLTTAEAAALRRMIAPLSPADPVSLTDMVALSRKADALLDSATELSSRERNARTHMPYKLMVPMLARRALYRSLERHDAAFEAASSCEQQTLRTFLERDGGALHAGH